MAAAALTPTIVQKRSLSYTNSTGTPVRVTEYVAKVTKATQNDWVVTATYFPGGSVVMFDGNTIDSNGDGVVETMTYTASGTKLTLTSATVGTTYVRVVVQNT